MANGERSSILDKLSDVAKTKAQELWEWTRASGKAHARFEWHRTQYRVFRQLRDFYEPPAAPAKMLRAIEKHGDEIATVPYDDDAERFLLVPEHLARRFEIERGWLTGRVNGKEVRFSLSEAQRQTFLERSDLVLAVIRVQQGVRDEQRKLAKADEGAPEDEPKVL